MKHFKRLILFIVLAFITLSCEEHIGCILTKDVQSFRVVNNLDELVEIHTLRGSVNYHLTMSPGEIYEYWQDLLEGDIEQGKIPLFAVDSISFSSPSLGITKYGPELSNMWDLDEEHTFELIIANSLWN